MVTKVRQSRKIKFAVACSRKLLQECYQDLGPLYERMKTVSDIAPNEMIEGGRGYKQGDLGLF